MNNPRIKLQKLRQALANQFKRVVFLNGESDDFRTPIVELSNSQKSSLFSLSDELANLELTIRLNNRTSPTQQIIEFEKFAALRPDLMVNSQYVRECCECDDPCTHVFLTYTMGDYIFEGEVKQRPISFMWQVYCENHLPTFDD